MSAESRKLFIEVLKIICTHIEIEKSVRMCRDPKDNKILELAINGNAELIITGDQDLLVMKSVENIKIVTPLEFYACNIKK